MTLPFWLDPPAPLAPPLQADLEVDVAVIGGGICGVSATLALARAGLSVALLEGGQIAGSATGRNAGFILQGTAERYDRAVSLMGRERARRIHAWSLENHARMAEVIEEEGIDCDYARGGSLQLASSALEEEELVRSAALLNEDGFEAQLVEGEGLGGVYTAAGFRVGVVLPRDGELHPARFVRGAALAAQTRGAILHEGSPVMELEATAPGEVRLRCSGGEVRAQLALVCTNARARELLPWYADKVDPVRGQMLATSPAPRIFQRPIYADHGYDYWRQDRQGRVILGGWRNLDPDSEVGTDDLLHPGIQARMEAFIRRFSALSGVEITHRWSGTMGFSRDGLPLVGPAPGAPGALAAVGFTGHGFGFAWMAGEALAATVSQGEHPFATEFSPLRMR